MRPACAVAPSRQPPPHRFAIVPAPQPQPNVMSAESSTPGNLLNVANLRVNQRSQINEDTVEPSLAAQDINPIAYVPDLISHPMPDSYPVR